MMTMEQPVEMKNTMTMGIEKICALDINPNGSELSLPFGVVGFPKFNDVEIVYTEEELPFMHLREKNEDGLEFLVMQPYDMIPDYSIEIGVADLELLDIQSESDVCLLNIVTVHREGKEVMVNLVAPLVFNKRTSKGKQVIINNFKEYSSQYVLYDEERDAESCPKEA